MRVNVTLVLVVLILGLVDARRRRLTAPATTTLTSLVGRQLAEQPEELKTLWNNFEIHKLNARASSLKNDTSGNNRIVLSRQYPGFPSNPGNTNELPSPISPPVQPSPPPYKPPPGCLGPRGQYASLNSCANYLNCWDDVVVEQTCPAGLLFNDVTGYCDFAYNVKCGDRLPATPKPPLPAGSKLCPDPNGRYRSSTNCSEFYVCATGKPIKFCCPRGLVYSDILNVCDYTYNVDCKGTAMPKPTQPPIQPPQPSSTYAPPKPPTYPSKPSTNPPQPPTNQPQPPTYQPQPPTNPPQPPTYQPQPPTYQPQPPTYQPQPPTYQPQPPTYQPQPPTYQPQLPTFPPQPPTYAPKPPNPPKPPGYQPQPYPQPSYPGNPWLNQAKSDPWQQRALANQLEIDKEIEKQKVSDDSPASDSQPAHDTIETSSLTNPWALLQVIPPELMSVPCNNSDIHRLNDACTNVIVCRNDRPQMVTCSTGFSYDKPSDSCKPSNVAQC